MKYYLLEKYRVIQESDRPDEEEAFAGLLYRNILFWLETGDPDPGFHDELEELIAYLDESILSNPAGLIDLSLLELTEAAEFYRRDIILGKRKKTSQEDTNQNPDREKPQIFIHSWKFFLEEAARALLARLDEESYRKQALLQFSEVDFPVFEMIGGRFPHEAAQNFLMNEPGVDLWLALRYLDGVEDEDDVLNIIEQMILIRKPFPEQIILFAYLLISRPAFVEQYLRNEVSLRKPGSISEAFIQSFYDTASDFLWSGDIRVGFERHIDVTVASETRFGMLAVFEISQCPLSAAWVDLFEKTINDTWMYSIEINGKLRRHQPCVEFTASILTLFSEDELNELLTTSQILSNFFRHIRYYTAQAFNDLLEVLTRAADLFIDELEIQIDNPPADRQTDRRLQKAARKVGREIVIENGKRKLQQRKSH